MLVSDLMKLIGLYLSHFNFRQNLSGRRGIRQRLCKQGCWHRAYREVLTASFDGHPGAKFRTVMSMIFFLPYQTLYAGALQEPAISLDAHVHGLSELTFAMEDKTLEVQLKSPAMNLLAFEHKASTKNDIAAVENAVLQLSKPDAFFSFSGGALRLHRFIR